MNRATPAGPRTIAQKLDHLIGTIHPQDRGPLSYMEIAEGIKKKAGPDGPTVSHATIQKIRKGEIVDPKVSTLTVIAGFFGVPVTYFFDDAVASRVDAKLAKIKERVELTRAQRELAEVLENGDVRDVAVRMNGLSVGSLRAIRGVIDQARKLEGLPESPGGTPAAGQDGGS
ncbi:helix-turn-helix domain-containing protein [Streptomyces sp. A3M-1-3]|uniref:helix-turn-helix domain-containing protein n=1 Tax=Streptomyces sp. A3M-1-3 TaxID=2962044 RepID=UPI0020B7079C|nr:helix-turn-helix domain-containing protein [Streptomyces sp. A3M-1-3]MCP3819676.1 helix-turn-helix domain-containing protein [Streptomyces sp. A3M-1-3]